MLVGQQLGPFLIEKELGAGAMGAVYRGTYAKTGQTVAIKVMLPAAATNEQQVRRFEREAEILEQLRHPNIVRFYGARQHDGVRYYAMEYVQGESLDRVLARRGRLSWEEVAALGRQLCAALEHAHQKGIVHRDLKPSNLMLPPDGTLKLTDFGIAKDLDVTQLTETNCTVGTASYMSPEQCRGVKDLTHKSDLYSMGVVFYELLTGRKPFLADNVMDMFLAHIKGGFERPSRVVLDIPKDLDTLVCQLLEKKPEHRPLGAATVAEALDLATHKAEVQRSAGEGATRTYTGQPAAETDRDATGAPRGRKRRRKKKPESVPFYQRGWFAATGIVGVLLAVGLVLYLLFKPPSADMLYGRVESAMQSKDPADWMKAFDGPDSPGLKYLIKHHDADPERTKQMEAWKERADFYQAEKELREIKQAAKTFSVKSMDALSDAARKAFKAAQAEDEGDFEEARKIWGEVWEEYKDGGDEQRRWALLGRARVRQYQSLGAKLQELRRHYGPIHEFGRLPDIADEVERAAFRALRHEELGDRFEALRRWKELKEDLQAKPENRGWYLLAAGRVHELKKALPEKTDDEIPKRVKVLQKRLEEVEALKAANRNLLEARGVCLNIVDLYKSSSAKEFAPVVARARKLFAELDATLQPDR